MMNQARSRMARVDRGAQRRQRKPCIDLTTQRIAHHPPRPCIENHCQVDEAVCDGDVGDIGYPELVRGGGNETARAVWEDRAVVLAISGAHEASQRPAPGALGPA